jgi:hypothetical protein
VITEHDSDSDNYGGEMEDISIDESGRDTSIWKVGISDSYVDMQAWQWVEVKTSGLPQAQNI